MGIGLELLRILYSAPPEVPFVWQVYRKCTNTSFAYIDIKMPHFRYTIIRAREDRAYVMDIGWVSNAIAKQMFVEKLKDYCKKLADLPGFLNNLPDGYKLYYMVYDYIKEALIKFDNMRRIMRVLPLPIADAIFHQVHVDGLFPKLPDWPFFG